MIEDHVQLNMEENSFKFDQKWNLGVDGRHLKRDIWYLLSLRYPTYYFMSIKGLFGAYLLNVSSNGIPRPCCYLMFNDIFYFYVILTSPSYMLDLSFVSGK